MWIIIRTEEFALPRPTIITFPVKLIMPDDQTLPFLLLLFLFLGQSSELDLHRIPRGLFVCVICKVSQNFKRIYFPFFN